MNPQVIDKGKAHAAYTGEAIEGEYNGKPMLILNPEDRYTFQFGINKAKMILENIDNIRKFVARHG